MVPTYSHLIEIDEPTRKLIIQRVYADGRKEFFTHVELPATSVAAREEGLAAFCRTLGENLLLDSPVARELLNL